MTRTEFEQFRDIQGKVIEGDISFSFKKNHPSIMAAERIKIGNALGVDAILEIHYNPDADSKVLTIVSAKAGGPICRLCVDNGPHPPCMHSHKHALLTPSCPKNNLKSDVFDRPELDGKPINEVFDVIVHPGFCKFPAAVGGDWA